MTPRSNIELINLTPCHRIHDDDIFRLNVVAYTFWNMKSILCKIINFVYLYVYAYIQLRVVEKGSAGKQQDIDV